VRTSSKEWPRVPANGISSPEKEAKSIRRTTRRRRVAVFVAEEEEEDQEEEYQKFAYKPTKREHIPQLKELSLDQNFDGDGAGFVIEEFSHEERRLAAGSTFLL